LKRLARAVVLVALLAAVFVPSAGAVRFTDGSFVIPLGFTGELFTHTFEGEGGCGPALPYEFKILSGALPPGLVLSSDGAVAGLPEQAGSWSFWLELGDQDPPDEDWCTPTTTERLFTITIAPGLRIQQRSLDPILAGRPYSKQLSATGGGPKTWSVWAGKPPAGITLSSNGVLSGTPTAVGSFTFIVQVSVGDRSDTQAFTLSVAEALTVGAVRVPASEVGTPFRLELTATGGKGRLTWATANGTALPSGLALEPTAGVISGTPTVPGSYPVKVSVTDQLGFSETVDVRVDVAAKLAIARKPLPAAKVGRGYRVALKARGGVAPRDWRIVRGSIPAGVGLDRNAGLLMGTPTRAGSFRILVMVTDKLGATSTATFVFKVKPR
jgi:large repetitive protein